MAWVPVLLLVCILKAPISVWAAEGLTNRLNPHHTHQACSGCAHRQLNVADGLA